MWEETRLATLNLPESSYLSYFCVEEEKLAHCLYLFAEEERLAPLCLRVKSRLATLATHRLESRDLLVVRVPADAVGDLLDSRRVPAREAVSGGAQHTLAKIM